MAAPYAATQKNRLGRGGDPRMHRAVEAREADPEISHLDALLVGGFVFPEIETERNSKMLYDTDGVSLYQRRNQLMRRIRLVKQRESTTVSSKNQQQKAKHPSPLTEICQSDPPSKKNDSNLILSQQEDKNDRATESFDACELEEEAFDEVIYPQEEKSEHLSLSEKEKNEIEVDLFGKTEILSAYLPITESDINDFDEAVNEIQSQKKWALIQAQEKYPSLVCNKQKEMFLRWADFDVKQAAARYVTYWNMRHRLFGSKAFLPLTLDQTMEKEDMLIHQSGIYSPLPHKDTHGRALIWIDPSHRDPAMHDRESEIRYFWCIMHHLLEDETVQENGIVFFAFGQNVSFPQNFDRKIQKMFAKSIHEWLPVKFKAAHFIRPPPFFNLVLPIMKYLLGRKVRHRLRFHSGRNEEILASLSKYGISQDMLPQEVGGLVHTTMRI